MYLNVFRRLYVRPHLTSALCTVIDRPLVFVLAHNAVMDADASVNADAVVNQLVLVCLKRGKDERHTFSRLQFIPSLLSIFTHGHSYGNKTTARTY